MATTIESTEAMRAAFRKRAKEHVVITDAVEFAKAQGYAPETIAALERVRQARVRLALANGPHLYKQLAAGNANDPTPEVRAKYGNALKAVSAGKGDAAAGDVTAARAHKFKTPAEQIAPTLTLTRNAAIERFKQDGIYAQYVKVANLEPSGGGGGDRLGGLGEVDDLIRDGFARYSFVYKWLGEEARLVALTLITQEIRRVDGTPYSLEQFGRRLFPDRGDGRVLRGIAIGALSIVAGQLIRLYQLCPYRFALVTEHERELASELELPHE
mgnify:CR=1 FL=1